MLQAYTLDYDDFNTEYHYIYSSTKDEWRECGWGSARENYSVPTRGWIKLALKVKSIFGNVWEEFQDQTESWYTAYHGVRATENMHGIISNVVKKGKGSIIQVTYRLHSWE